MLMFGARLNLTSKSRPPNLDSFSNKHTLSSFFIRMSVSAMYIPEIPPPITTTSHDMRPKDDSSSFNKTNKVRHQSVGVVFFYPEDKIKLFFICNLKLV